MYYLCKRFQGEIELLIAKFQKQGRSLAKDFCHQKKEFFEKIYINREVVQEARHIAICVLGRRNEPINSSNVNEGFKEWSFYFFCLFVLLLSIYFFTIKSRRFVLNRLFKVWGRRSKVYPFSFLLIYLFKLILQWRVWSWLRMNASYRLNTCKSRGNDIEACFDGRRPAHGWVTRIQPASD